MREAECVWPLAAELGEGPVWSARDQALWFVDIRGRRIHRLDPASGERGSFDAPGLCGFVAPATDGGFVAGIDRGLQRFFPEGAGRFELWLEVEGDRPQNRMNDGLADPFGRLWFGTMDNGESRPTGALYRLVDGAVERMEDGIVITNGPVLSPDGRTFHHTDTRAGTVFAYDADARGVLTGKRVFHRFRDEEGHPDGSCTDAEGALWVSLWGAGAVVRLSPEGRELDRVRVPVAQPSKPALGGPDLKTLYITTAWKGLDEAARAAQPLAGGLFAVEVDVPGAPPCEVRV